MIRILSLSISLLCTLVPAAAQVPESLRVMSFNIRYRNPGDGDHVWDHRKHLVIGMIRLHRPGILGVQEALPSQLDDLGDALEGYRFFGEGRDGGRSGEHSSIFFDAERYRRVSGGTFWLSPTPERRSRGWDAALRRICTWGEFRAHGSVRSFYAFNTHFDHRGKTARRLSARLLVRKIGEIAGDDPAVLLGDFNARPDSKPYAELTRAGSSPSERLRDARLWTERPFGSSGTFTGFDDPRARGPRIDYVFVKNAVRVVQHAVLSDAWQGRPPSDHRPVRVDLELHRRFRPTVMNLSHRWRFRADPAGKGEEEGWVRPEFDDAGWEIYEAGESWERQGKGAAGGVAWLRRRFELPTSWREEAVCLELPGVSERFRVHLNGVRVASFGLPSRSRRIVLHLPPSALRFGQRNVLALRVQGGEAGGGLTGFPVLLGVDRGIPTHDADSFRLQPIAKLRVQSPQNPMPQGVGVAVPIEGGAQSWLRARIVGLDRSARFSWELRDEGGIPRRRGEGRGVGILFEHRVPAGSRWRLVLEALEGEFGALEPLGGAFLGVHLKRE